MNSDKARIIGENLVSEQGAPQQGPAVEPPYAAIDKLLTDRFGWPWKPAIQTLYAGICDLFDKPIAAASLPESQPSPSGDAHEWCLRNNGHQFVEEYCSAEIYDCMTEFAKAGQSEQRLHRINELLELLRNCGMQGRAQSYVQEIRELVAALQESHSDR